MSDSVTNVVSNTDPRPLGPATQPPANAALADLFSDVFHKTSFAERMFSAEELDFARAAERELDTADDAAEADFDQADDTVDESANEANENDERGDSDSDTAAQDDDGQSSGDGESDQSQTAAATDEGDAVLDLKGASGEAEKTGLDVQPNEASGVELKSKSDGTSGEQSRVVATAAELRTENANTARNHATDSLGQRLSERINAMLSQLEPGNKIAGQDAAAARAGQAGETPWARNGVVKDILQQLKAEGGLNLGTEGDADALDQATLLRRAGGKLAAELHQMKMRLMAHREALKEAIVQSQGANNAATQAANSGASKPVIDVTTAALPPAPAAHDGPNTRPATLFNSQLLSNVSGQPGSNGSLPPMASDSANAANVTGTGERPATPIQTASTAAARPAPTPQPYQPVEQVKVQIQQMAKSGADRIQIRLTPASLGRVEVALEMTPDKTVQAIVYAEKSETLDMLERDARVLQQALEEAGMKFDSDGLTFKHGQSSNSDTELADGADGADGGTDEDADGAGEETGTGDEQPRRRSHDGVLDVEV